MKALAIIAAFAACCSAIACIGRVSNHADKKTYQYDLTQLNHADGEFDTLFYRATSGDYFYINVCGQSGAACSDLTAAVCMRTVDYDFYSHGSFNHQTFGPNENATADTGISIAYTNGDQCEGSGERRSTNVLIFCKAEANPGYIYDATVNCTATLRLYSSAGCGKEVDYDSSLNPGVWPGSGGDTAAIVILVILIVGIVLFFGGGALYIWRFKDHSTFTDFIIFYDFWVDLPGLIKDGVLFIAHGFKKGDYVSV